MSRTRSAPGGLTGDVHTAVLPNCGPQSSTPRRQLVSSQQVSWWDVHEHVTPILEAVGEWPTLGTPEWCALADDHPAKLAALLDAAQHWALRVDTCQTAECEASHAISTAADWSAIATHIRTQAEFNRAKPWMKRATA